MCSTWGWIIKRCSLERNLFITWAVTESAAPRSIIHICTLVVLYAVYKLELLSLKNRFINVTTIIFFFYYPSNCETSIQTCCSGALRPRDYQKARSCLFGFVCKWIDLVLRRGAKLFRWEIWSCSEASSWLEWHLMSDGISGDASDGYSQPPATENTVLRLCITFSVTTIKVKTVFFPCNIMH